MQNKLPILYSFRRCPYAMRARLAIAKAGVDVELREVVLKDKPEEMLKCSDKGTVPVLHLQDSHVIDESIDIMRWALNQNDPDGWLVDGGEDLLEPVLQGSSFKISLDRYKYPGRYDEEEGVNYLARCEEYLQLLENALSNNVYLMGDKVTYIDAAIAPFIRQFAFVDKDWFANAPYKNVRRWLDEFLESDLFESIMLKYDQWQPGDIPVIFPPKNTP